MGPHAIASVLCFETEGLWAQTNHTRYATNYQSIVQSDTLNTKHNNRQLLEVRIIYRRMRHFSVDTLIFYTLWWELKSKFTFLADNIEVILFQWSKDLDYIKDVKHRMLIACCLAIVLTYKHKPLWSWSINVLSIQPHHERWPEVGSPRGSPIPP